MADVPPSRWSLEEVSHQVEQELHAWSSSKKADFEDWTRRMNQSLRANEADSLHPSGRLAGTMHALIVAKDKKVKQERLNTLAGVLFYAHRMVCEQNRSLGLELNDCKQQLQGLRRMIPDPHPNQGNPGAEKEKETFPKKKEVIVSGACGSQMQSAASGPKRFYVSAKYKGNRPQENYVYQSPLPLQAGFDRDSDEEEHPQQNDKREKEEGAQERDDPSTRQYEDVREMESYSPAISYVFCQPRERSPERFDSVAMDQRLVEIEQLMKSMQGVVNRLASEGESLKASLSGVAQRTPERPQE